jgi:DNA-binding MarR family transcriptional regulator
MTAAAREWAWAQRLPESRNGVATHAKVILLFLAERCDSTGTCWPSVAAIADATGVSRRSFIRLIDWLVSLELIERDRRHDADGRRKSNLYRLRLSATVTPSKVTPRHLGLSAT